MAARGIPTNPNLPRSAMPHGLEAHWSRTIVLLCLFVLISYLLYARSAPIRLFVPPEQVARPPAPRLATATAIIVAPVQPKVAEPAPIIGEARPQLAGPGPIMGEAQPQIAPDAQVRAAINTANDLFRVARASADASGLASVATGPWLADQQRSIDELRAHRIIERWTPLRVDIQSIAVAGTNAVACTTERWERVMVQGALSGPVETLSYTERYTLVWRTDRWLVSQIEYPPGPCAVSEAV